MLIEESEGLANAAEIARSSDRLEAIIFGAGDLSASQRARVDGNFDPVSEYPGDFWHFARFQVVTAARAAGIDAIDAPYPAYQDPDGYRRSATHASLLGFDGKWAIHPSQIEIAHEVFSPTPDEVAAATRAIEDYRDAGGRGRRRDRARWPAGGRGPHAPRREHAPQGGAGGGRRIVSGVGRPLRVVQWATGNIGSRSLRARHRASRTRAGGGPRPLAPTRSGCDAGELCGTAPTGIRATATIDDVIALEPDCVLYMAGSLDCD